MPRKRPLERPLVGLTLDAEPPGGYSGYHWMALRRHYTDAVVQAGGLPVALPTALPLDAALAPDYLARLDGLVITGGNFDIDPALYNEPGSRFITALKPGRTAVELALLRGALARRLPVLGICGGAQLLAVALGGTLWQHVPHDVAGALPHEQPTPRHEPGHSIAIRPETRLARIVGQGTMQVNSAHHQAVRDAGPDLVVNATAPDGIIEGIEHPALPFCLGVQWHPEFGIDPGDQKIFHALIEACG